MKVHKIYCIFLGLALIIGAGLGKIVEIRCPSNCRCDLFENFKRANCSNQRLAVLETSVPPQTELLDLSFNQISHLTDHIFFEEKLISLKLLNISHNRVSEIHMNAFEGLNSLKTLDLTDNSLRYLLINWFWSLTSLEEVYLRGNSFGRFGDEPLIESKTLKIVDISKCAISHIGRDAFVKVPNLEVLNLAENYLIQLDVSVIRPIQSLIKLNVRNNSFSCNDVSLELGKYCTKRGIGYDDPCKIAEKPTGNKFERIVAIGNVDGGQEEEKNSWIFDDGEPDNNATGITEKCNTNSANNNGSLLMEIIKLSPPLSILIPFIYGIAIGILIGCSVQIKSKRAKSAGLSAEDGNPFEDNTSHLRKTSSLKKSRSLRSLKSLRRSNSLYGRRGRTEATESLVLSEWDIPLSTPVTPRRKLDLNFDI